MSLNLGRLLDESLFTPEETDTLLEDVAFITILYKFDTRRPHEDIRKNLRKGQHQAEFQYTLLSVLRLAAFLQHSPCTNDQLAELLDSMDQFHKPLSSNLLDKALKVLTLGRYTKRYSSFRPEVMQRMATWERILNLTPEQLFSKWQEGGK